MQVRHGRLCDFRARGAGRGGNRALPRLAPQSIAQYGGRNLVRGGAAEAVEGGPPPKTLIIVEFPSMQRLREWYASPNMPRHRRCGGPQRIAA
jgi:hypothetical protein